MQRHLAPMRTTAMLDQEDALPCPQRQRAADHRQGELGLRQRDAQMRRHVVCAFAVVLIERAILGREPLEKLLQVAQNGRVGVLLDEQRRGSMAAEDREQAGLYPLLGDEMLERRRDGIEALAACVEAKDRRGLAQGSTSRNSRSCGAPPTRSHWKTKRRAPTSRDAIARPPVVAAAARRRRSSAGGAFRAKRNLR